MILLISKLDNSNRYICVYVSDLVLTCSQIAESLHNGLPSLMLELHVKRLQS